VPGRNGECEWNLDLASLDAATWNQLLDWLKRLNTLQECIPKSPTV